MARSSRPCSDADGDGVDFSQSYGASTDQAKAVAAGQPADSSSSPPATTSTSSSTPASSTRTGTSRATTASPPTRRRLRRPRRQPEAHQGLGRPDQAGRAGRDARPVQLRLGEVEHPRRLRRRAPPGQDRRAGDRVRPELFKNVVSQDTSGSNATNTFLAGKGDVLITYESEAINARLQGKNIQYVIPRQTMLIELPIAVHQEQPEQGPREPVHPVRQVAPAQELFAQFGFRPVNKQAAAKDARSSRHARASSRSTTRRSAAGASRQEVVRPERRPMVEDRAGRRRADRG